MTPIQILCPPVNSKYGAPMGRCNQRGGYEDKRGELHEFDVIEGALCFHLVKVPRDSGGYDRGGAYWGHSATETLWGYIGPIADIRGFVWAPNRETAKAAVREIHEHARFFK